MQKILVWVVAAVIGFLLFSAGGVLHSFVPFLQSQQDQFHDVQPQLWWFGQFANQTVVGLLVAAGVFGTLTASAEQSKYFVLKQLLRTGMALCLGLLVAGTAALFIYSMGRFDLSGYTPEETVRREPELEQSCRDGVTKCALFWAGAGIVAAAGVYMVLGRAIAKPQ
ncbi:MAG TPA: hypothetical protein V6C69_06420 [Trichormus sp.]|jgi:hypothetical protein